MGSLSEDEVYEIIVELYAKERTVREIAKEFNVSKEDISRINTGKVYPLKHYTYPIR
tara:strand:+ start:217 stop:387 length:171 start_codon:yes stop_codon:yes gene_type:complete